jgi:hypothetical protein
MRLRVPTELWAASLLATLGVAPVACGGRAETADDGGEGATGGTTTTSGGTTAMGGSSAGRGGTAPGTGGSTAGSGAIGGTGAIGNNPFPCESPRPVGDSSTGFVQCDNGFTARPFAAECPSSVPRANPVPDYDPATDLCHYDSDCTEKPNGYCGRPPGAAGGDLGGDHWCQYGCVSDGECGAGYICLCGDPVGRCVEASCTSDESCGEGFHCASYDPTTGCSFVAFACQTSGDECVTTTDCGGGMAFGEVCNLDQTGKRACTQSGCAIGRPFLVDEVARMAGVAGRSDWLEEPLRPSLTGLDVMTRERLASDWLRAARLEHASIAAFSRFLLELLAFGAPADLVARTIQAMEDERRHAKLCFALASAYAGLPLGPGELDLEGALPAPSLEHALVTAIREGCVGETIAALEAAELGERVADPVLASVLTRIAADEKRHAELAFQFVKWAILRGDERTRAVVDAEIERVKRELASTAARIDDSGDDARLARSGVLGPGLARSVRAAGLEFAVLPGLESLIEAATALRAA